MNKIKVFINFIVLYFLLTLPTAFAAVISTNTVVVNSYSSDNKMFADIYCNTEDIYKLVSSSAGIQQAILIKVKLPSNTVVKVIETDINNIVQRSTTDIDTNTIYNEGDEIITSTYPTTRLISSKSGAVISNVTTMSHKIPSITVTDDVSFSSNTTYGSGAILNSEDGKLEVKDKVNFLSNTAFESGGAIYNLNLTTVTIIGSSVTFSYNNATNAGGAIYSIGNLQIGNNVKFSNNGYNNMFYYTMGKSTDVTVKISSINKIIDVSNTNAAIVDGGNVLIGGAIYMDGGSIYPKKQKWLSIGQNATFENNSAYKGGAMYVLLSSVTIGSNATFYNNSANYMGGAIYVFKSTFTIQDGVNFSSNSAKNRGGAIYAFDTVLNLNAITKPIKFSGNTGGGIYFVNGEVNLNAKKYVSFDTGSSVKSTGTAVLNIMTSSAVFFNADVSIEGGTITLNSGKVIVGRDCNNFDVGTLNLSTGTTLSLSTGTTDNDLEIIQRVNVGTFTATENVNLEIDVAVTKGTNQSPISDSFSVENNATGTVILSKINISSITSYGDNFILFNGGNLENLRIKIPTTPINYSNNPYMFFLNPEDGVVDFSIRTTTSNISGYLNTESSTTVNAVLLDAGISGVSGTLNSHLAIYGNNNKYGLLYSTITVSETGALSLFNTTNNSKIENRRYLYAEDVKFSEKSIQNSCLMKIDSATSMVDMPSSTTVKFIAYNSTFSASPIINISSITLENHDKEETKNFIVKMKLNSVEVQASTKAISCSTYIKIDSVTNTNINNKIICLIDSANIHNNNCAIYSTVGGVDIETSSGVYINSDMQYKIGDNVIFQSNKNNSGGAIYNSNSFSDTQIDNFVSVDKSSFTSTVSFSIGKNAKFSGNEATNGNGGAIYNDLKKSSGNVTFNTNFVIGSSAVFNSNTAKTAGGAIYNCNGTITFEDGIDFSSNSANQGGAIYNSSGTINLTAKEYHIIFNGNKGTGGAIYDSSGTINLTVYNGKKIVFQTLSDTIVSKDTTSILNINKDISSQDEAIIEINSDMSKFKGTTNIYSGFFKFGKSSQLFGGKTIIESAIFDFSSNADGIKNYDLSNFTINNKLGLLVDVDLSKKEMDTISSTSNSAGSGSIYIQNFNLTGNTDNSVEILFTSSTALKRKVTSLATASSSEYIYDVGYDQNTGYFTFTNRFVANPTTLETPVALLAGAMATQENVLNRAFVSMNTSLTNRHDRRLDIVKDSRNLYASTENFMFLSRSKIEGGFWLRPYAYKENLTLAGYDIESTIYGALAGLDLKITDTKLLSFYIGYTGVNQTFKNIKVDENGYVFGATGMLVKEKFYLGLTANAGVSDTTAESSMGSNDFQINTYTIGLKGGYEFDLSKLLIFEPNMLLMYGYTEAEKHETEQGAKISKEGFNNFRIEPQLKFNFNLDDGWKPYVLLGYIFNTGETNAVINGNKKQTQKLDPYCEYGAGLEKSFIGTAWVGYAQVTGKTGGKKGVGVNLGIKYAF